MKPSGVLRRGLRVGVLSDRLVLGRYRALTIAGTGRTAVVYAASDQSTGRAVAVKSLRPYLAHSESQRAAYYRQGSIGLRIAEHPNVMTTLDYGMHEATPLVVSELIEGETLSAHLAQRGRLDEVEAIAIAVQVADGVAHLHASGFCHRDLRAGNVMLVPVLSTGATVAKIIDLGSAWPREEEDAVRNDVHAVLSTLFEATTGRPLPGTSEPPTALDRDSLLRFPAAGRDLLSRALVGEGPETAAALGGALRGVLSKVTSAREVLPSLEMRAG